MGWALGLCLAAIAPALAAAPVPGGEPPAPGSVELVHAESNEGNSSGGHIGLAIGDRVYHFQAVDGRLLLARPTWSAFLLRYNSLDNRGVRRLPLSIAPDAAERIRVGLERRRSVQGRHLEVLQALERERAWLRGQADGAEPRWPVRGAALFAPRALVPSAWATALREAVEQREPSIDWAALVRESARAASAAVGPTVELDARSWQRDSFPSVPALAADRLAERLEWREAVAVLAEGRPLDARRLLEPPGLAADGLSRGERRWLEASAARLEEQIARLVVSARPDRGRALLVAVARHRVARRSLAEDRFRTLDPFDDEAPTLDPQAGRGRRHALDDLAGDFAAVHRRLRRRLDDASLPPDESSWRKLEESAARHRELSRAVREGVPVRIVPSPIVPWPRGPVAAPRVLGDGDAARRRVEANLERVRAALDRLDGYDLFTFNCATELAAALEAPFGDRVELALGGRLEGQRGGAFVPAGLLDRAARRLATGPVTRMPSYRERRLATMRTRENDGWVWLRESNTLSAQSYQGSARDGHFLLFTDQAPALRPVAGAINLTYGTAHALIGLVTWPFDGGRRLVRGARGAFFSIPELAFVGLRKGTYEYTVEVGAQLRGDVPARLRAVGESGAASADGDVESQRSASSRVTPYQ